MAKTDQLLTEAADNGQPESDEGGGRKMDEEVRTMSAIIRILEGQSDPAAYRIMDYLYHRYVRERQERQWKQESMERR